MNVSIQTVVLFVDLLDAVVSIFLAAAAHVVPVHAHRLVLGKGSQPSGQVIDASSGGQRNLVVFEQGEEVLFLLRLDGRGVLGREGAYQQLGAIILVNLKMKNRVTIYFIFYFEFRVRLAAVSGRIQAYGR